MPRKRLIEAMHATTLALMDSLSGAPRFLSSIAGNSFVRIDTITHIERRRGTNRVVVAVTAAGESTAVWQSDIVNDDDGTIDHAALAVANAVAEKQMWAIAELVAGVGDVSSLVVELS